MPDWNEIRRPFRNALIDAFDWSGLSAVLIYHCDRRLDRITAQSEGFDKNVDDVIADAVRTGWLEKLAEGALTENPTHTGLRATVPLILQGTKSEGRAYYQGTVDNAIDSAPSGRTGDLKQDQPDSSAEASGSSRPQADTGWTSMLQAALDQWRSNLSSTKSLSRAAGQAAALAAAVTAIGTLLYRAFVQNQEELDYPLLVFGALFFAAAAFIFVQIWGGALIFTFFFAQDLHPLIQTGILAATGGITGLFVFYTMVQTLVYSWAPGVVAGLVMGGLAHLNVSSVRKADWTVPILSALLTMFMSYTALVISSNAEWANAFGVLATGIFIAILVDKLMKTDFLTPGKRDFSRQ